MPASNDALTIATRILYADGAATEVSVRSTLYWAIQSGHVEVLNWLTEKQPALFILESHDFYVLRCAVAFRQLEVLKWLSQFQVVKDVLETPQTSDLFQDLLSAAVGNIDLATADWLLRQSTAQLGTLPNVHKLLTDAVRSQSLPLLRWLLFEVGEDAASTPRRFFWLSLLTVEQLFEVSVTCFGINPRQFTELEALRKVLLTAPVQPGLQKITRLLGDTGAAKNLQVYLMPEIQQSVEVGLVHSIDDLKNLTQHQMKTPKSSRF